MNSHQVVKRAKGVECTAATRSTSGDEGWLRLKFAKKRLRLDGLHVSERVLLCRGVALLRCGSLGECAQSRTASKLACSRLADQRRESDGRAGLMS